MKKINILSFLIIVLGLSFSSSDHLIFNRITIIPDNAEFVSIYNPTEQTINLSDYYITDNPSSIDYYNLPEDTNSGAIDNINVLASLAKSKKIWLHVDGAYGLAALADPQSAKLFKGIEKADSFIVDPHKWLFAPYDSCALLYKDARKGSIAHGQRGNYLDAVDKSSWNPSDFALHLTRRPRGLPLWFSLAVYGSTAYAKAIKKTIQIAKKIAIGIKKNKNLELILGPQLTVILFRSKKLNDDEVNIWSEKYRRNGALLCLPTTWKNMKVLRICVVNPNTDPSHVIKILKTLN